MSAFNMQLSQVRLPQYPTVKYKAKICQASGRVLLVRYSLGQDVHHGIVCGVCPGCLQQGKKIQSTEPSVEHKVDLKPEFDSKSASGTYWIMSS
jgi:hypothetical protein